MYDAARLSNPPTTVTYIAILLESNKYFFQCSVCANPAAQFLWTLYLPYNDTTRNVTSKLDVRNHCFRTSNAYYTFEERLVSHKLLHGGFLRCKAYNQVYHDSNGTTATEVQLKVLSKCTFLCLHTLTWTLNGGTTIVLFCLLYLLHCINHSCYQLLSWCIIDSGCLKKNFSI